MQSSWSIQVKYSTYQKSPIFCFAQLLMQILVNFQNQWQIWNLLVLRFSKHPLHVQFDQVLVSYHENKRMVPCVFNLKYLSQNLVKLHM